MLKKLAEITEKAEYLNKKSQELIDTNKSLREKVKSLEADLAAREEELDEVRTQYDVLKLARNMEGEENENAEELKKKINEYIREIDQVLKLIGD